MSFLLFIYFSLSFKLCAEERQWAKPVFYSLGLMAVEFGALVALDLHDDDPDHKNFENAFKHKPRDDDDDWRFNNVLHPLMGSETYLRARQANFGIWGSFLFSAGASVFWEYFIESWTEHPSRQDLIRTPGYGSILGEFRYLMMSLTDGPHWFFDPINELITHIDVVKINGKERFMLAYHHSF